MHIAQYALDKPTIDFGSFVILHLEEPQQQTPKRMFDDHFSHDGGECESCKMDSCTAIAATAAVNKQTNKLI